MPVDHQRNLLEGNRFCGVFPWWMKKTAERVKKNLRQSHLSKSLSSFRKRVKDDSESASGKRHANPVMAMVDVMSLF